VLTRLRRVPASLTEASQDLGASGWQTRRGNTVLLRFSPLKGGLPLSALELVVRTGRIRGAVRLAPDRTSYRVPFVDSSTPFRARIRGIGLTGRRGPRTTVRLPARHR
jgi:hypothetical protein